MKNSRVSQLIFALLQLKIIKNIIRKVISAIAQLPIIKNEIHVKKITKCLILFHPRSGSSWLIKLLEENKNFRIGGEIFGEYQYNSGSPNELEQKSLLNNFYDFNIDRSTLAWDSQKGIWVNSIRNNINIIKPNAQVYDEITIICKISPYQVINKKALIEFVKQNNIKVICLTRDDIFKLAVSAYRKNILYKKTRVHNLTKDQKDFVLGSTKLEKSKILSFLEINLSAQKDVCELANLLASNKVDLLHLTYEKLFENTDLTLQKLEDFIGAEIKIRQTEKIFKITDDRLPNIISNYQEFQEWMYEYLKSNELDSKYFEYLN